MRLAIDAMGSDNGCTPIIHGAVDWIKDNKGVILVLVGDGAALAAELKKFGLDETHEQIEIVHCSEVVGMGDKFETIKRMKDSSISRSVQLVKSGEADALISMGNTTATVGAATLGLRHIKGVRRSGIAVTIPSGDSFCMVCDMGASVNCKPKHLADYGIMASVYSSHVLGVNKPRVGILNVGEERGKGNTLVNEAFALLEKAPVNFIGNVEGCDMWNGTCDVIVCDGFVGNAMLKCAEGVVRAAVGWIKSSIETSSLAGKIGAYLSKSTLKSAFARGDASTYGGMPLLGVNGICLIGHGSTKPLGVYNALKNARQCVEVDLKRLIAENTAVLHEQIDGNDE